MKDLMRRVLHYWQLAHYEAPVVEGRVQRRSILDGTCPGPLHHSQICKIEKKDTRKVSFFFPLLLSLAFALFFASPPFFCFFVFFLCCPVAFFPSCSFLLVWSCALAYCPPPPRSFIVFCFCCFRLLLLFAPGLLFFRGMLPCAYALPVFPWCWAPCRGGGSMPPLPRCLGGLWCFLSRPPRFFFFCRFLFRGVLCPPLWCGPRCGVCAAVLCRAGMLVPCCLVQWFVVWSRCLPSCVVSCCAVVSLLALCGPCVLCCLVHCCAWLLFIVCGALLCWVIVVCRCPVRGWAAPCRAVVLSCLVARCCVFCGFPLCFAVPVCGGLGRFVLWCASPCCVVWFVLLRCISFFLLFSVLSPVLARRPWVWRCCALRSYLWCVVLFLLVLCWVARLVRCCGVLCWRACVVLPCAVFRCHLVAGWCLVLLPVFRGLLVGLVAWCCPPVVCFGAGVHVRPRGPLPCRSAPWFGSLWCFASCGVSCGAVLLCGAVLGALLSVLPCSLRWFSVSLSKSPAKPVKMVFHF